MILQVCASGDLKRELIPQRNSVLVPDLPEHCELTSYRRGLGAWWLRPDANAAHGHLMKDGPSSSPCWGRFF